jgi:outer membrane lipase/esterase
MLDYDVTRDVRMGVAMRHHAGSTDGSNTAVGVNGGYEFGQGALRNGPVAGLLWQSIDVDGYSENNVSSTALAYSDQSVDSLVGSLGWQVRYQAGSWEPYLRATWDHEFEDGQEEVFARLQTLPDLEYAVPGVDFDGDFGTVVLGARFDVFGLAADLGARTTAGQAGANDTGVFVSLGGSF